MISVSLLTGCDQSQGLSGPDSGDEATASAQSSDATAPEVTIGSHAELIDRLPEIGTPLEGSGQRIWLSENGSPLPAGTEHTTGAFKRRPHAYGLSGNVELPEPDAIGFTSSNSDVADANRSGASKTEASTNEVAPNRICLPGETPPGCEPPPPPCYPNCDGGGGGGDDDPPSFDGSSALYFNNVLRLGETTASSTTDLEGSTVVDRVFARTTTSLVVNGGEYEDTGFTYTYSEPDENEVSAITHRFNYAGQTDYDDDGEHWYKDDDVDSNHKTSAASLQTNFPTSTCAPFPIWIQAGHEDGKTYQEEEEISLEWQTICPQFDKQLRIRRTDRGGASSWVTTSGDGWLLDPLTRWHGLFLGDGDYEWRIRADGESNYRTGTFSIESDCSAPIVNTSYSSSNRQIDVILDGGCLEPGTYFFRLEAVSLEGGSTYSSLIQFDVTGSGGGNITAPVNEPNSFPGTASRKVIRLYDSSQSLLDGATYVQRFAIHPGL